MKNVSRAILVMLIAGAALITVGVSLVYVPAGIVVLGLILLAAGVEGLT